MEYSTMNEEQRREKIDYQKQYNKENKEKVATYQQLYYQKKKQQIHKRLSNKKKNLTDEERQQRLERNRMYSQNWKNKLSDEEREHYRQLQKKYREENREKLRNYRKNKPSSQCDTKENNPKYFKCFCGKYALKTNKSRHDETSSHIEYMEMMNMICVSID